MNPAARVNSAWRQRSTGEDMALQNLRALSERVTIPLAKRFSWMSPLAVTWMTLPVGLAAALLMLLAGKDTSGAFMLLNTNRRAA